MTELERAIRAMTVPRNGVYPRPWTTYTDPEQADVLIVGASSAKTFNAADVGSHDRFLDALWNRNGQSCEAMYHAATEKPSPTRGNLDRLSAMLAACELTSLQTNVTCASARYDVGVLQEDRAHGVKLFKAVVAHVPWKAMIVYGVGASEEFGRAFGVEVPPVPSPDSLPVSTTLQGRPVFISPTLAFPAYRSSVWPYLERVVAEIARGSKVVGERAAQPVSPNRHPPRRQRSREQAIPLSAQDTLTEFNASAANLLVQKRMIAIEANSALELALSTKQASLYDRSSNFRVFRHEFTKAKADILVREDVFSIDPSLRELAPWTPHSNPDFQRLRTNDLDHLERILDAVSAYAAERAP